MANIYDYWPKNYKFQDYCILVRNDPIDAGLAVNGVLFPWYPEHPLESNRDWLPFFGSSKNSDSLLQKVCDVLFTGTGETELVGIYLDVTREQVHIISSGTMHDKAPGWELITPHISLEEETRIMAQRWEAWGNDPMDCPPIDTEPADFWDSAYPNHLWLSLPFSTEIREISRRIGLIDLRKPPISTVPQEYFEVYARVEEDGKGALEQVYGVPLSDWREE